MADTRGKKPKVKGEFIILIIIIIIIIIILLSPLCKVFTTIYLNKTMFLGYVMLQLFCIYRLYYM